MTTSATIPVTPRIERLPLGDLGWEAFEAFSRDLIARLPMVRECHHYGKQGDTQSGIDLCADLQCGERWAFQNKRWKQFGPEDAEKAIQATTYRADRYVILLSREATAGVRDAVDAHPRWGIWDVRDISQKVRELPLDSARRLLDHHFESVVRRAFLGVPAVSTFPTPEDFFRHFEDATRLFHHAWALVGRSDLLRGLHDCIDSPSKRIAVFSGRGGIGKTRLLLGFSRGFESRHPDLAIRFLAEGMPVSPDSFDDLPMIPCVVVVDDAHRRAEDMAALLICARQRGQPLKVVLASRPEGADLLNSLLSRSGFDEREVSRLGAVGDLTREETRQLARQALGADHAHLADRLVAATRDCPLVTVVGGKLLAERGVEPALLERLDEFRHAVLSKFQDVLLGQVGDRIDPAFCRALLPLLSAVGPFQPENQPLLNASATFLRRGRDDLEQAIRTLEDCGVLSRRGYTLRVTPDVLADHVLHNASLDSRGRPTGFVRRVFDHFGAVCLPQVLRNFAELDWRVRCVTSQGTDLLAGVWGTIEDQFRAATNSSRCQILDQLREVAYYQPGRMLGLVRYAMRNPASVPDIDLLESLNLYGHEGVLGKLPSLLERISYTLDYLPCCADLLWELGRDDARATNARHEHPMRVLQGMAEYQLEKPFAFNRAMVDAVARWMDEPGAHDHAHSPLEVLDPVFAKSGSSSYAEGHQFVIRPFKLSSDDTQALRDEALAIAGRCASSENPKVALRALKSLEKALRRPLPEFNLEFTREELAQWEPEQRRILVMLKGLREQTTHPVVQIRLTEVVGWHARHAAPDVKRLAREVLDSATCSFEERVTHALVLSRCPYDHADPDEDYAATLKLQHERRWAFQRSVAQEVWQRTPDLAALARMLNDRALELQGFGMDADANPLLAALLEINPQHAVPLAELVLATPESPLAWCFALLVATARRGALADGAAIARRAVESGLVVPCRGLANLYCWSFQWCPDGFPDDLLVLHGLLRHSDTEVRRLSILALRSLAACRREAAIEVALAVDVGSSGELAESLCAVFHDSQGVPPASLSLDEIAAILRKLEPVDRLDHHVMEFLAYSSSRVPRHVVELLLHRVERGDRDHDQRFEPLPYLGLDRALGGLAESGEFDGILRSVRDRSLARCGRSSFWFPKLFAEVSLGFRPDSLKVLAEWVDSGDARRIVAAASLLREAPAEFVFDNQVFVSTALVRACSAGEDCHSRVSRHLHHSATSHGRERRGGGAFPQDVAMRDRAAEACKGLRPGSPAHRFYESLKAEAVENIRDVEARDEEGLG